MTEAERSARRASDEAWLATMPELERWAWKRVWNIEQRVHWRTKATAAEREAVGKQNIETLRLMEEREERDAEAETARAVYLARHGFKEPRRPLMRGLFVLGMFLGVGYFGQNAAIRYEELQNFACALNRSDLQQTCLSAANDIYFLRLGMLFLAITVPLAILMIRDLLKQISEKDAPPRSRL